MKQRLISGLMAAVLLFAVVGCRASEGNHNAVIPEPVDENRDAVIQNLNELLAGVQYDSGQPGEVARWSDDAICDIIYGKLMSGSRALEEIGLEFWCDEDYYEHFDLDLIQKITRDTLGRDFPTNTQRGYILVSGDELLIMPAGGGEGTTWSIQDFRRQGEQVIAVGTAVGCYSIYSEFLHYFRAVFAVNPSSIYGYTLVSLEVIEGNQSFDNLTASASSELAADTGAENVLDGNMDTTWAEGVSGLGINEWIKLETADGSDMGVSAIEFHTQEKFIEEDGWAYRLRIEYEGGLQEGDLFDISDTIVLEQPAITSWIKITILEASAGTRTSDTRISEIRLRGMDAAAYFQTN